MNFLFYIATDVAYAIMLLPYCLGDKPLVAATDRVTPYPHMKCSETDQGLFGPLTSYIVCADRLQITTCKDLVSALTSCFICYWLFNIKYPKIFCGQLGFLDNLFKKNSIPVAQKVANFMNKF